MYIRFIRFTFQYGSTYIFLTYYPLKPFKKFTFQYGSTYIDDVKVVLNDDKKFTFQYGSTYINSNYKRCSSIRKIYIPIWFYLYPFNTSFNSFDVALFTFQYGSTYIGSLPITLQAKDRFTFQYGSTYMNNAQKLLLALQQYLHSNMVLLICKKRI